jgi:single-stranded-DNA-specific exonuclease
MAAGLTIAKQDLKQFEQHFLMALEQTIDPSVLHQQLLSDGELNPEEISLELAELLPNAAPWGQGFAEPQFHGIFTVIAVRTVGQQQDHLRLTVDNGNGQHITAMAFRQQQPEWLGQGGQVLLRYRLAVNKYRQQRTVQMLVENVLNVD